MFTPPFCPHRGCPAHLDPDPRFSIRHGSYPARCRPRPIPRFRCRSCKRTFSRQTFRADYRDHKPHLNVPLFRSIASGVGIRQSARNLGLSLRCTELKFRKIARHCRRLNANLLRPLRANVVRLHMDEFETFETERNTRPLTVPVVIESESRYIVWAESAPIRPRGKMTPKRRRAVERAALREGPRKDGSRRALARCLARAAGLVSRAQSVVLDTDQKQVYRPLARAAFGRRRLKHRTTNSRLVRGTWNPLFAINHEEAILRDLMGRLRRESWLVSKKRRYLDLGLQLHMAYRNLVRRRFNCDEGSPAGVLGLLPRRLRGEEVLSWRQVFGVRSPHPASRGGVSVKNWPARRAA